QRASIVLVDSVNNVIAESGDVRSALDNGAIAQSDLTSMAQALAGITPVRPDGDLKVFKSVGTALQDLALAASILDAANGRGRQLGELAVLKVAEAAPQAFAASIRTNNGDAS